MKMNNRFNKPKYIYEVKIKDSKKMGNFYTLRKEARYEKNEVNNTSNKKYVIYRHEVKHTNNIIR